MQSQTMSDTQFDPFGEPVTQSLRGEAPRANPASVLLLRSGIGLFWMLVVGILAARVVYFDPDFADRYGSLTALTNTIRAILNA
ncbi:hypothetical protein [Methylobacterium nigriterrae]|uniref:hypothetical protein n=1 Tax=Methylobacterium nigriterrae TaxID=3127512 RepID=UPI003013C969